MRLADDYRRDGYALAEGAIHPDALDQVAGDIYGVFRRLAREIGVAGPETCSHKNLSDLLHAMFAADRAAYLAAARQAQYLISVHRLGLSEPIERLLDQLGLRTPTQSTRPVIHFMSEGLRFDGGYHKTPAHQDWRSVQGSLDGLTLWLPLWDVGARDFPLEVVPASHQLGLLDSVDDAFGHRIADGQVPPDAEFRPLEMRRGDLAAFSGFLVHRTGACGGGRVRVALSYRFNNAAETSYVARRYPIPYSYRADMSLLGFSPRPADLARYFAPLELAHGESDG